MELSTQDAVLLGKRVKADYVITGTVAIIGSKRMINIRAINVIDEKDVLTETYHINDESLKEDHEKIARSIINLIQDLREITISEIKAYIEIGDWENAIQNIERYRKQKPGMDLGILNTYHQKAASNLARMRFDEAKKFLENGFFDKAKNSLNGAIKLQPMNNEYAMFGHVIDREYEKFIYKNETLLLNTARGLLDEGKLQSADDILGRLEKMGSKRPEILSLRVILKNEMEAESQFRSAKKYYSDKRYADARISINRAMKIKPTKTEYRDLLSRIDEKEKLEKENNIKKQKYVSYVNDLNAFNLFVEKKRAYHFENIAYVNSTYTYIDNKNFTTGGDYRGKYTMDGIEGSIFRHRKMPYIPEPHELVSLQLTGIGSFLISGLYKESKGNLNSKRSLDSLMVLNYEAGGSIGPSVNVLSYLLGAGLDISMGYMSIEERSEVLFGSKSREVRDHNYFKMGIGWGMWFSWMPGDRTQVFIRYRSLALGMWGTDSRRSSNANDIVSIGIGYRFF